LSGATYPIVCVLTYVLISIIFTNRIWKTKEITAPGILKNYYKDNATSIMFAIGTSVSYVGNVGVQVMAGKALFEALGLNGNLGAVIIVAVILAYSALSGLWGAFATSVVQCAVITVGLVLGTISIFNADGLNIIRDAVAAGSVPETYMEFMPNGPSKLIFMLIPLTMALAADQGTVQRINSSKSLKDVWIGWIVSILVMIPVAFMPALIGMYGKVAYGASGTSAFFTSIISTMSPLVYSIIVAAVLSAIMSSCDSLMVGFNTVVLNDIYKGLINPKADDKTLHKADKLLTLAVSIVALVIALAFNSIIDLLMAIGSFKSAMLFASFFGALYWKRGTSKGAVASSIIGAVLFAIGEFGLVAIPQHELVAIAVSGITYIVVSLATYKAPARA
ncbi:MAG: sodium:solute symporter family protein, partial [Mailhella sp.]|nr:sodium:solute symporter family protein [Mailhella sp.]